MADKPGILFVSKPVVPPWSDSGKNLVRDVARAGSRYHYHLMSTRGAEPLADHCVMEPVYSTKGAYSPGLGQSLSVLARLWKPDRLPIYHFFFAPNKKTSSVARMVFRFKRRRTVHTICSVPRDFQGLEEVLFADRMVALSRHTKALFEKHSNRPVIHIPPCIPIDTQVSDERMRTVVERLGLPNRPLVLFAGDYQFSNAAKVCCGALPRILADTEAHFVFACRIKQEASRGIEAQVKAEVEALGLAERVSFLNEVDDMEALAAAVAINVLPADSLYAKMDIPLVLLESLREGVPIVVSDHGPLPELMERDVGRCVATGDSEALAGAVVELMKSAELRRSLGDNGRQLVRDIYSPAPVAAAYEELYDSLLQQEQP